MRHKRLALSLVAVVVGLGVAGLLLLRGGEELRTPHASPVEPPPVEVALEEPARVDLDEGRALTPRDTSWPATRQDAGIVGANEASRVGVALRVLDAHDLTPLEGALLRMEDGEWLTDESGECFLPVPEEVEFFDVSAEREGYCRSSEEHRSREADWPLLLDRGAALHGRVLHATSGAPVPGATITFGSEEWWNRPPETAATDECGTYTLPLLPLGQTLCFEVAAAGFATRRFRFELALAQGGDAREYDFLLEPGVLLRGEVVDYARSTPVSGAVVRAWSRHADSFDWDHPLTTDERGRFEGRIRLSLAERNACLQVEAEGYCTLAAPFPSEEYERAGALYVRLPELAAVEGRVTDVDGRPIEGAGVRVREDGARRAEAAARGEALDAYPWTGLPEGTRVVDDPDGAGAKTDEDGRFRACGLVPGRLDYSLTVWSVGFENAKLELPPAAAPGGVVETNVVLARLADREADPPSATIRGRVTRNGEPVSASVGWEGESSRGYASCDEQGRYEATEVPVGEVELEVWDDDDVTWNPTLVAGAVVRLRVAPDQVLEHDFDLHPRLAPIAGRVVQENGRPAGDLEVDFECPGHEYGVSVELPADGSFSLDVIDAGVPYTLGVWCLGERIVREGVMPGTTGVELVVPTLARLAVRVRDERSGALVSDYVVGWRRRGEERFGEADLWSWDSGDSEGWRDALVAAGSLELIVCSGRLGYRPRTIPDCLAPAGDEPARLEVELARGLEVTFALAPGLPPLPDGPFVLLLEREIQERVQRAPEGEETWKLLSRWFPSGALRYRCLWFDESGRAVVGGLEPGPYRFLARGRDLELLPEEIEVREGAGDPILLRWSRR